MKIKFVCDWPQILSAFRSAGALMVLQGLLFSLIGDTPLLVSWAKGSVLVGLLMWAGASLALKRDS